MARFILLLCLMLASSACERPADTVNGRIVSVADGDTFTLLAASRIQVRIRLDQIDAPETGQAWSQNSKKLLRDLLETGPVRVEVRGKDRYGRAVGRVYAGRTDVNLRMVEAGGAWAYRKYLREPAFQDAEIRARANKRGLWSLPSAQTIPPWTYRDARPKRASKARPSPRPDRGPTPGDSLTCGTKRYCAQMRSCGEAIFYLRQCGVARLDADRDGMPCEITHCPHLR